MIVPPATDAHLAHRMTRALAAVGLVGAGLKDTLVLTGWTPWGPLAQPNAYFSYDGEAERTKEWAIHCHASQVLLTDYTKYCSHLGRAYAALTREWAEGHSLAGRAHRHGRAVRRRRGSSKIETYDPANLDETDPIHGALRLLHTAPGGPSPANLGRVAAVVPDETSGPRDSPGGSIHAQRRDPSRSSARDDRPDHGPGRGRRGPLRRRRG